MAYEILKRAPKYDNLASPIKGVKVRDYRAGYRGQRFQFLVYDAKVRKNMAKRFDTLRDGEAWAADQFAAVRTDQARAGRRTLADILPGYLKAKRGEDLAIGYMAAMQRALNAAVAYGVTSLKSDKASEMVNDMLNEWVEKRGISKDTLRGYQLHFRNLGSWLLENDNAFAANPFRKVALAKLPKLLMPTFTPAEMARIVACWDSGTPKEAEEARYFITLAYTGMRCRELAWARRPSFLWEEKRIRINLEDDADRATFARLFIAGRNRPLNAEYVDGLRKHVKGDKERTTIFMDELMALWRPLAGIGDEYIFSERFRRANSSVLSDWLVALCARAKVDKGRRHLHHFRSTFAATCLAADVDSLRLVGWLGHDCMAMTAHYSKSADAYGEACKGWGKQLRWRQLAAGLLSNNCPKPAVRQAQPGAGREVSPAQAGASASEDEQEIFIVVPDTSELYRETLFAATGTYAPGCAVRTESKSPLVSADRAWSSVVNTLSNQVDTTADDIGCPS